MISEIVKFLLGLSIVMMISCQSTESEKLDRLNESEIYKGELTFKLISFDSYYALPDTMIQQIELYMDSLKGLASASSQDQEFSDMLDILKENKLITKPCFHLKIDSSQTIVVYLNEEEYHKLTKFDRQSLINENKKIVITLKGKLISQGIVECYDILKTEELEGKTYWRK